MGAKTAAQINSSMPTHVLLWTASKLFVCFAIAICVLSAAVVTKTSSAQERVRVGTSSRGFGALPIYVADKKGFYAKFGLRPEIIMIRSSVAVPALLSGDLDYYNGVQPAVSAALKGLPIKLVMMGGEKVFFLVLVKPEVRTLNDLKGKTIGVSAIGSTL